MARNTLSPLRRKELAQVRRAATAQVGLFCGIGPQHFHRGRPRLERDIARDKMLIAYAVALGVKRGVFASDIEAARLNATVERINARTSIVNFDRHTAPVVSITLSALDWAPGPAIEETIEALVA